MRIILASSSPRRKELLKLITKEFEVIPSDVEEKLQDNVTPKKQVENLSYIKAKSVFDKQEGDRIVIGSDTMVVKNNRIYGKPKNKENAKEIIELLLEGDKTHSVITGLTVLIQENGIYKEYKTSDEVKVYLKNITEQEIENWISTGKAMDKAGAYAANEEFSIFIEKIEGHMATVIGFPVHKAYDLIKEYIK